ncbi:MAG TPA: O-antigen ligase family protein [Acidocella sp.]|jgi:O-antigen ligase|uniref:O-antigen ligase family protein n=1 Tax=Acidocella sp. TaxID=50710 RepID=UPI002D1254A7|nr:O-antigen ligase family protein [Acidocella sp.]HVE21358.1 O-antigen ligase family protein [Acidocella sp.]
MLRKIALVAAFLVPFGLLHAFPLAEIGIFIVDVLFLATMARRRELGWARQPWFVLGLAWWAWLLLCSTPFTPFGSAGWVMGFVQALVILRLLVFAVALQTWLLVTPRAQKAAWLALVLSCLWVGVESWQQFLTGSNIFGDHRWADGSLTGPFWKPRAGALYMHLLFPAMLPVVVALLSRAGTLWRSAGALLALIGVVTSVLIGQRMGVALTGLGVVVTALFIRQLRFIAVAIVAVAAIVIVATPVISPPTYAKLVHETSRNLSHFSQSPYGELYTRATVMGLQSPWHGWGYNGFRELCPAPRFDAGLPALGIAPTQRALGACNLHPHNYYVQAFVDAGVPGLILFVLMALSWMVVLGRNLFRAPEPLRVGLFVSALTFTWPLGSTDEFPALYMVGWLFFILGLGFSLRPRPAAPAS